MRVCGHASALLEHDVSGAQTKHLQMRIANLCGDGMPEQQQVAAAHRASEGGYDGVWDREACFGNDRRLRWERVHASRYARRRLETGRENMPRIICSSGGGSTAHQWPSLNLQRSTWGAGFGRSGGKTSFTTGCIGTASLLPNKTSWYGTRHERSRGNVGQGVMTMVGIEGSSFLMTNASSSFYRDVVSWAKYDTQKAGRWRNYVPGLTFASAEVPKRGCLEHWAKMSRLSAMDAAEDGETPPPRSRVNG